MRQGFHEQQAMKTQVTSLTTDFRDISHEEDTVNCLQTGSVIMGEFQRRGQKTIR
jgi:hypothetical protein